MHTVELLEAALEAARGMGYEVREEWLGGTGGGLCVVKGRWRLFVDLQQSVQERLDETLEVLATADEPTILKFPPPVRGLLDLRKSA
jgi:hypothetical protein